ncbi:DNA topoisomerase [Photobacterium leiognathi]|uniref:DNA topoisomerase n=1 Tax=Photobacterium leiognathi TaxID=553611 RepID=UPI002981EFFB|nr:DNA topoisomerase [Photobacterium leiognathi]
MIQSNSAHEPIEIIVDESELAETYKLLAQKHESSSNDSYLHMSKTLKTLEAFDKANNMGDCEYQTARVLLQSNKLSSVVVELETHVLAEPGWTEYLSIDVESIVDVGITKADLVAFKQGNFSVEVSKPQTTSNLTVNDLLSLMDRYMIGRPSTYSDVIRDLQEDSQLLDIDGDNIRLTTLGFSMAEHLTNEALDEFSPIFSLILGQDLEKIGEGQVSPLEVLMKYLPLVADEQDIDAFMEKAWHTLSDIKIEVY